MQTRAGDDPRNRSPRTTGGGGRRQPVRGGGVPAARDFKNRRVKTARRWPTGGVAGGTAASGAISISGRFRSHRNHSAFGSGCIGREPRRLCSGSSHTTDFPIPTNLPVALGNRNHGQTLVLKDGATQEARRLSTKIAARSRLSAKPVSTGQVA